MGVPLESFSRLFRHSSITAPSSASYSAYRGAEVPLFGHPVHAATPLIPECPPATSRGASLCSIKSSQQTDFQPAAANFLVQKVLPLPDIPTKARRECFSLCNSLFMNNFLP